MKKKEEKLVMSELSLMDAFAMARYVAASLTGELTDEERARLEAWRQESERHEQLYRYLLAEETKRLKGEKLSSFDLKAGWEGYRKKRSRQVKREICVRLLKYAAVIILPFCVALYFLIQHREMERVLPVSSAGSIAPGESRAHLVLSDGKVINLTENDGVLLSGKHGAVVTNQNSRLSYVDTMLREKMVQTEYHETFVPRCGEYQLALSDGTVVYLNSMSSLRYPVRFADSIREVELEGEAYFRVAEDAERPFIVKTSAYRVTVLGTSFNISSYKDEAEINTTLVEGTVLISGKLLDRHVIMRPNEQFCFNRTTGMTRLSTVDVSSFVAWKDGMFRFRDVRLEDIMRVVERWYDVKVVFLDEESKNFRFGFNVSRHSSIDPLLRVFELNGKVNIQCEGKELRISKRR